MHRLYQRPAKIDRVDSNDLYFSNYFETRPRSKLPVKVDLRPSIQSPVIDQGLLNSCTACAISVAVELLLKVDERYFTSDGKKDQNASQMYIYYNERLIEDKIDINAPVYIRDGIKSLSLYGVCSESVWPYLTIPLPETIKNLVKEEDSNQLSTALQQALSNHKNEIQKQISEEPSTEAVKQADNHKFYRYLKLSIESGLGELKQCLSKGIPFIFGLNEPISFFNTPSDGLMALPAESEVRLGGHAMIAVGYDDEKSVFIVRNSYGAGFGDLGYCYIPYEFMTGYYLQENEKIANSFSFWCFLPRKM